MAGRSPSFSAEEIETLRKLARDLKAKNDWSGTRLGKAMGGIKQQNASRFVADKSRSGIDRTTANALAVSCGYRDVEHALLEAGTFAPMKALDTGALWTKRDRALALARQVPYPESAILAVMHRYADVLFKEKPIRWWMDRISAEALAHEEEPQASQSDEGDVKRPSGTEGQ